MTRAATSASTLDDVIITRELAQRSCRPRNIRRENRALLGISAAIGGSTDKFLKRAVAEAQRLCGADAAGLSLMCANQAADEMTWVALSGTYAPLVGGTVPRSFSPCGTCISRKRPELFLRPQRHFQYLGAAKPALEEVLVFPMFARRKPIGTLWLVTNSAEKHFDRQALKTLRSFAAVIGAALQMKLSEDQLRQSEGFSREILEANPDCVKVLDANGSLEFMNDAGCKLLDVTRPEQLMGKGWLGFWDKNERPKAAKALKVAERGGFARFEGFRPTLLGTPKWWDVRVRILPGSPSRFLVVSRDITILKQTEAALRTLNDQLELRVKARTAELASAHRRLIALARQLVQTSESERRHLAKELHDEMGQHLTALKLTIESMRVGPLEKSRQIGSALGMLQTVMRQVRTVSFDLRQSLPDHISLETALRSHFMRLKTQHGLKVRFACLRGADLNRLPGEISRAALRVVQESLTNVIRHAQTSSAVVKLRVARNQLSVDVADRGVGFVTSARRGGIGLRGMEERVLLLGGQFHVDSGPGRGTVTSAALPLEFKA